LRVDSTHARNKESLQFSGAIFGAFTFGAINPDLAGQVVDFGTAEDGSLEIWIADKRYTNVDDIPDARVRDAISEAVEAFNI
jgi:hypothetical protein